MQKPTEKEKNTREVPGIGFCGPIFGEANRSHQPKHQGAQKLVRTKNCENPTQ